MSLVASNLLKHFKLKDIAIACFLINWTFSIYCLADDNTEITDREAIHKSLLDQVNKAWDVDLPKNSEANEPVVEICSEQQDNAKLESKLKKIVLPKINFSDLSLSQALQMLSDLSEAYDFDGKGVNFILVDPQKRNPSVNLSLKNLSLHKLIDYIAQSTGFDYVFDVDVVIFQKEDDLPQKLETKCFKVSRSTVLQIIKHSFTENVDQSEESALRSFFEKAGIGFNLVGAGLAFDGSKIIISNTKNNISKIRSILSEYNEINQVAIEAKFLEVQQGALDEIGFKWRMGKNNQSKFQSASDTNSNLRNLSALQPVNASLGRGTIITANKEYSVENIPPSLPNSLNLGSNSAPVIDAMTVLNGYEMGVVMQALEQNSDSDLMSAPKLTVLSGRRAEIIVAQELRYPEKYGDSHSEVGMSGAAGAGASSAGVTITAGTPMNFVTRNVGVEMFVTPTVDNNNMITLALEPCVTEFEGFVEYGGNHVAVTGSNTVRIQSGYFQPIFSRRQIKTEVSIQNGSTVVMGGLTREETKETHDKIPFLSSIPIFGNLFKSKGQTTQKRNLLIFVTANLLSTNGSYKKSM